MDYHAGKSHVQLMAKSEIASKVKALRVRAGMTVREVARELDDMPPSTYATYEATFKKPHLPMAIANRLAELYERKGIPRSEVMALAGVTGEETDRPKRPLPQETRMAAVEELDVVASAGAGANVEGAIVLRTWLLPREVVSISTDSPTGSIKILRVKGDSMSPTYNPLDRILVDTGDTVPSPGGVFVVWDGLGLVVKRVQLIPHSDPLIVKITSDNPKFDPYDRTLDEAYIQGRVIGKWLWT